MGHMRQYAATHCMRNYFRINFYLKKGCDKADRLYVKHSVLGAVDIL